MYTVWGPCRLFSNKWELFKSIKTGNNNINSLLLPLPINLCLSLWIVSGNFSNSCCAITDVILDMQKGLINTRVALLKYSLNTSLWENLTRLDHWLRLLKGVTLRNPCLTSFSCLLCGDFSGKWVIPSCFCAAGEEMSYTTPAHD